jgi:tRNA threonylcarbamoyladenosine biosynthesis protein TsaE
MNALVVELSSRRATIHLGQRLGKLLGPGDLVILDGPLGSGKTFLVRAVCRALGLPATTPVTSPTFTLVHELATRLPVAHADLYRLEPGTNITELGLDALRAEGRLLLVEWGTPFLVDLGGDALIVKLQLDPRRAFVASTGPRSTAVLSALGQC